MGRGEALRGYDPPVSQAAKDQGSHQHPGHVDGLGQLPETPEITHQVPLQRGGGHRGVIRAAGGSSCPEPGPEQHRGGGGHQRKYRGTVTSQSLPGICPGVTLVSDRLTPIVPGTGQT